MVLPLGAFILRDGHTVGAYIPGDRPLLFDVGNVESQVRYAMTERRFQVLSNRIAPVNGLVVRRKVDCICSVDCSHSVQISRIPMPCPFIAHPADRTGSADLAYPSGRAPPFASGDW